MGRPVPTAEQQQVLDRIEGTPHDIVIGIDEVGFGSWAGPLVVGGVVLPRGWDHPMVLDSKALTPKRRSEAATVVLDHCWAWHIASLEAPEVDREGVHRACERLTQEVVLQLSQQFEGLVVLDGNGDRNRHHSQISLPKADSLIPAVSAASILAKVWRDDEMVTYHDIFPYYFWQSNKGYGSKAHQAGLDAYGPCVLHRFSYKPIRAMAKKRGMTEYADRYKPLR